MAATRRDFLKIAGASTVGLLLPPFSFYAGALAGVPAAAGALSPAAPGSLPALTAKRWAMAVQGGKCPPGCRDCIDACHAVHNVPDFGNAKDEIKWIWREEFPRIFPEENHSYLSPKVRSMRPLVLCNHCTNPPCVRVCPTKATFRREDGIVMMDYHRCIGCRFCMAACPYGARSMNYRDPRPKIKKITPDFPTRVRGVVEKCNFCEERLAKGILPACVLACKEKALIFGDPEDPRSEIRTFIQNRFTLRRRPTLGTEPQIYYSL